MTDPDIVKLRASIDEIDNKLIALLNERSGHVKQVGMTKKKRQQTGQCFIRSGREAEMIRRIYSTFKEGTFPAEAAAQIWRMIICASLSLESPLTVTAYAPTPGHEIYWLAREYFGYFTPVTGQPTAKRVLGDILDGKAEVGVMPLPEETQPDAVNNNTWWLELPETIRIFACVPFILSKGGKIKALAVAKLTPEDTGDDMSIINLQTDMNISQSRLKALFEKNNLTVRWLAIDSRVMGRAHLIEIKGFITPETPILKTLSTEIGNHLLALRVLGSYATPLIV